MAPNEKNTLISFQIQASQGKPNPVAATVNGPSHTIEFEPWSSPSASTFSNEETGGYYGKILAYFNSLKRKFTVVGLAYDNQKVDEVIHDELDQKLNYILTEKQLYKIL